jgi:hypothetical protein
MKTGILAADAAFGEMTRDGAPTSGPLHMQAYERSLRDSWVMRELSQVLSLVERHVQCWFPGSQITHPKTGMSCGPARLADGLPTSSTPYF